MCELFAMSSAAPATVSMCLDELARRGGGTGPHKDGWGAAFYEGRDVRLFKEPEPAFDSALVQLVQEHGFRSTIVLAHVRLATRGAHTLANTQPFVRELAGRMHTFAHNGDLEGIERDPRFASRRFQPVGESDSERAFCSLLEHLAPLWESGAVPPVNARLEIVAAVAAQLRTLGQANFIYSDGLTLFVHGHARKQPSDGLVRPPGVHTLDHRCHRGELLTFDDIHIQARATDEPQVFLVTSLPLSEDAWTPLEAGELLAIEAGRIVART